MHLLSCIFHNIVESVSIKSPHNRVIFSSDGCRSGTVIKQSKFPKTFSWLVSFQKCWFSTLVEDLCAVETTTFQHIHTIALIAFNNHLVASFELHLFNSINYDVEFLLVQCVEHESLQQSGTKLIFSFCIFRYDSRDKVFFFVELTEYFSTYTSPLFFRSGFCSHNFFI